MGILDDRMVELGIKEPEDQMKCFGDACRVCKCFFQCPMHWGDEGAEL